MEQRAECHGALSHLGMLDLGRLIHLRELDSQCWSGGSRAHQYADEAQPHLLLEIKEKRDDHEAWRHGSQQAW